MFIWYLESCGESRIRNHAEVCSVVCQGKGGIDESHRQVSGCRVWSGHAFKLPSDVCLHATDGHHVAAEHARERSLGSHDCGRTADVRVLLKVFFNFGNFIGGQIPELNAVGLAGGGRQGEWSERFVRISANLQRGALEGVGGWVSENGITQSP